MPKKGEDVIERIPLLLHSTKESITSPIDRRSEVYRHAAAETLSKQKPQRQPIMTIPNILTFIRLLLVPVLLIIWEWDWVYSPLLAAYVFIAASITDWLDGYLARRLKIATVFGAFLDPVADKIMVSTALILLTVSPPAPISAKIMILPVAIMICREVTMSSLREWAASAGGAAHKAVKVNSLGKWKTALQMVSMSMLLLARQDPSTYIGTVPYFSGPNVLANTVWSAYIMMWLGTGMAVWSLAIYMANVWTHFIYPQGKHL